MKRIPIPSGAAEQRGFTIIELMITLTLVAILAAVAVPSMRTYVLNNRVTSTAQALLRSIQTARSEATKLQGNVVICTSANPTDNDAKCATSGISGWIVFRDMDDDWDRASSEDLIEVHTFDASKLGLLANESQRINFARTGFVEPDTGTLKRSSAMVICDYRGNTDSNGGTSGTTSVARGINITATGRASVTNDRTKITSLLGSATCPTA